MKNRGHTKSYGNSTKMFLTDIKSRNSKRISRSKKKYKSSHKENEIMLPIIKKFEISSKNKKTNLKNFINVFKKDMKILTEKKLEDFNKEDIEKFNNNIAEKFLDIQKSKIESEIQNFYLKKSPNELQEYLNKMENKTSFKKILIKKREELIQKKKVYNSYNFKLQNATKNLNKINALLAKYSTTSETNNNIEKDTEERKDFIKKMDEITKNITHERECLENVRKIYKSDIIILKKKCERQKEKMMKLIKNLQSKNKELNKQKDMNNNVLNELEQQKFIKSKANRPFFAEEVHRNYSFFEENIRVDKILSNEAKIQQAIKLHNQEEKMKETELIHEQERKKNSKKQEDLKEIKNELKEYEEKTEKLMEFFKVNEKMQLLSKVYELKSSKESLKELKKCYQEDINLIQEDIEKIRAILDQAFVEEAEKFELGNKNNKSLEEREEENLQRRNDEGNIKFENQLMTLDEDIKIKNQLLFNENIELNQMNKIILDSSSTISRILFQLDPQMSSKIQISKDNIVELLSFVGLQLEKILSFLYIEGNVNLSCEDLDYIADYDMNLNHTNKPPSWLRIYSNYRKK